jgi:hypothetical protein
MLAAELVHWHSELPPIAAEQRGEHVVEATSARVQGTQRSDLRDRCYDDLMARFDERLRQELARLGGHYAHVLEESIDSRRDDATGEAGLYARVRYTLLRRASSP